MFDAADRVLDLEPTEQQAFLERYIIERPAAGAELKALIDGAAAASALETPASVFSAPFLQEVSGGGDPAGNGEISLFGPYRVLREIARGGMGAVYLAERSDDQYRKEVALKVLPPWSGGGRRRHQRFLEERQILAGLDHPDIARLLDGGVTTDGLPWFAMEYVDGLPIDQYCDSRQLSIEERLALFRRVCSAVQYAHRNLVVHRDLKPSNILVGAGGRVALLDFGIARLLTEDPALVNASQTTGDRLLTPLYASPEQIRGEQITTASDIYALGVLLHVLLTGGYPYRLSSQEGYEVARAVLEQEPERPSASVVRETEPTSGGRATASVDDRAQARASTPAKLVRRLRGDLDAIVLKAMDKEPGRRYSTAEQLETDVRRHLTRLPVLAQPDSRYYVARKFVRRHRAGVGITAAVAVLVLTFSAVMTVQRSHIRAQAQRIAVERDLAEQVSRFLLNTFQSVTPGDSGITARDILDSATGRIEQQLTAHPEQRARLMFEMGRVYHRLDLNDRALALLDESLALRRGVRPRRDLEIAETQAVRGAVLLAQGSAVPAEQAYREALDLRRRELGPAHGEVARTLGGLSSVLLAQQRLGEAERLAREAVSIDQAHRGDNRADLAHSTSTLARVLTERGDHAGAAALFRQALTLVRETRSEEHPEVASAVFDLGASLNAAGETRTADSLIRYGLGLQRRLLTAARLRGIASFSLAPAPGISGDVTASVQRAFSEQPITTAIPAGARTDGRIVFTSDRDGPDPIGNRGNQEVYVMNADGTEQRRLTNEKAADFGPTWSPDGRRIAFTSQRVRGFDIFLMNADGTGQQRLTDFTERGLGAVEAAWSPDGKWIAFRSRVKQIDIYVINVDGTGLARLTNDPGIDAAPAWSPDGRKIAFVSQRDGNPEIYVMNADGRNVVRLTFNDSLDRRPAWSPDGRRIAFHSNRDGDQEIYVMNADGSNPVRLTHHPGEDAHPSWSPDGRRIVFFRRVLGHAQIHVMNADGSDVKRLTELSAVAFNAFPNWGPAPR